MKSSIDGARLRLSAIHPEMSIQERDRASSRIGEALTEAEIDHLGHEIGRHIDRLHKQLEVAKAQWDVLKRAVVSKKERRPR